MSSVPANTINVDMQDKSPFEQRIGKVITTCPKCHGEGKVRGNLTKKAKAKKKLMQSNNQDANTANDATNSSSTSFHIPKKPCKVCSGTGLLQQSPSDVTANTTLPSSNLSVAIVGGGIGGFALAAALQHRNIDCVVYERDASFEERKQGYGLVCAVVCVCCSLFWYGLFHMSLTYCYYSGL